VLYTSVGPVGAAWRAINWGSFIVAPGAVAGVACASESSCIAVDGAGNGLSSSDPTTAWELATVDTHPLTAAACPSASLCIAADDRGDLLTAEDPSAGASAWTRARLSTAQLTVRCTSAGRRLQRGRRRSSRPQTLCLAFDTDGRLFAATDPRHGPRPGQRSDARCET
jgi:hypothetical protein